jgi:hypothetical protein
MPIVTKCSAYGCETLTMGPFCIDHEAPREPLLPPRRVTRQQSVGVSRGASIPHAAGMGASPRKIAALRGA